MADKCPLCAAPAAPEFTPFCSLRCKDRDLLNWLGDAYAIPVSDDMTERETGLDSEGEAPL